jgi:hypothetical protein
MKHLTIFLAAITLFSCSSNTSNTIKRDANLQTESKSLTDSNPALQSNNMKISLLNNPKLFCNRLSSLGIGNLNDWHSDGYGWMSSSHYFEIGPPGANDLSNNLAFYLDSENENFVQTAKLVLNINNSGNRTVAIKEFVELTEKTFEILRIEPPKAFMKSLKNRRVFEAKTSDYQVQFIIDKSNIDTWKIIITSL